MRLYGFFIEIRSQRFWCCLILCAWCFVLYVRDSPNLSPNFRCHSLSFLKSTLPDYHQNWANQWLIFSGWLSLIAKSLNVLVRASPSLFPKYSPKLFIYFSLLLLTIHSSRSPSKLGNFHFKNIPLSLFLSNFPKVWLC